MRAYTPTSSDDDLGYFDLIVKVYFANNNPAFPLVSQHVKCTQLVMHPLCHKLITTQQISMSAWCAERLHVQSDAHFLCYVG